MPADRVIRCAILNPLPDGRVVYFRDGLLVAANGRIAFVGAADDYARGGGDVSAGRRRAGVLMPPMLDVHTHIPQWPIRGGFLAGVPEEAPRGRLLAGLERNVYPAEMRSAAPEYAAQTIALFRNDALAHGVVGGCAFMTVHPVATTLALEMLGDSWLIGPVLMDQNCPPALRSEPGALPGVIAALAESHGPRTVIADRFAVACSSSLRRAGAQSAHGHGLRMQTHLNEQSGEKEMVRAMYPAARTYAHVYEADGLLARDAILAHCIHMADEEWQLLCDHGASVAHCPTSNTLLGSGVMSLDSIRRRRIAFALATDVGASPTTSLLAEARQFLLVQGAAATPEEAFWRITQAPAEILRMTDRFGSLREGAPASFVVVDVEPATTAGETIGRIVGWRDPGDDVAVAVAQLRTGLVSREAIDTLSADISAAMSRIAPVTNVVIEGADLYQTGGDPPA